MLRGSKTYLGLPGVVHLGDEVGGRFEGSLPLLCVGLLACRQMGGEAPGVSAMS